MPNGTPSPSANAHSTIKVSTSTPPLASLRYTTEGRVQPASRTKKPFTEADIEQFTAICESSCHIPNSFPSHVMCSKLTDIRRTTNPSL